MKPFDEALVDVAHAAGARGITRTDVREIWESVKRNRQMLESCAGPHDFSIDAERQGTLVRKYRCTKCGGEIDATDKGWYERGLVHGQMVRR